MPFGSVCFETAQFMPIATKENPSRINEFVDEMRNDQASECRLFRGIPRLLPTVHEPTAYSGFSSELLPRTIAAYTEQAREEYGKGM
jgi:hypothetical protein